MIERTNATGRLGEAHFLEYAALQKWDTYIGLPGSSCDFIVDTGDKLFRVEAKCSRSPRAYGGYVIGALNSIKFDYLFVSLPIARYFIPSGEIPTSENLRGTSLLIRAHTYENYVVWRSSGYIPSDESRAA